MFLQREAETSICWAASRTLTVGLYVPGWHPCESRLLYDFSAARSYKTFCGSTPCEVLCMAPLNTHTYTHAVSLCCFVSQVILLQACRSQWWWMASFWYQRCAAQIKLLWRQQRFMLCLGFCMNPQVLVAMISPCEKAVIVTRRGAHMLCRWASEMEKCCLWKKSKLWQWREMMTSLSRVSNSLTGISNDRWSDKDPLIPERQFFG